jgi:thymidylate kinase
MTLAPVRTRPLVVEFVGAPGAGKSTLLPVVAAACRDAGLTAWTVVAAARPLAARTPLGRLTAVLDGRRREQALWLVFRWASAVAAVAHIVRTWPLAWRVLRSQWRRPTGADAGERRVLYWLFRLLGAHALFLARGRPGEVLLLDEGYVHRVVQLFSSAVEVPDPDTVTGYLETVPSPDLVVVVEAPADRCVERVRTRGVWARLAARDPDELARFVANAHRAATLAAASARACGWEVVTVDNGAAPSTDAADALRRTSRAWFGDPAVVG